MSKIDDGGAVIDLRDYFAAKAMAACITALGNGSGLPVVIDDERLAERSYEIADAMLVARDECYTLVDGGSALLAGDAAALARAWHAFAKQWPGGPSEVDAALASRDAEIDRLTAKLDELSKAFEPKTAPEAWLQEQCAVAVGPATRAALDAGKPEQPNPDADGWTEWNGGECPVPEGVSFFVRFRDGDEFDVGTGEGLIWKHDGTIGDIIAYRIVSNGDSK